MLIGGGFTGFVALSGTLVFKHQTVNASGVPTDATSVSYRIYGPTGTGPMTNGTGTMAVFDGSNTDGYYSGSHVISSGDGYERGSTYCIRVTDVVSAVTKVSQYHFIVT